MVVLGSQNFEKKRLQVEFTILFDTKQVYGGSDVGVSTIVGSEIFNVLCIIGGAVIVNPDDTLYLDKVLNFSNLKYNHNRKHDSNDILNIITEIKTWLHLI